MSSQNSSGSETPIGKVWDGKRFAGGEPVEPYTEPSEVQADLAKRRAALEKAAVAKQNENPAA